MNQIKDTIELFLSKHPQLKQWGWFVILWLSGLLAVTTLSYPIKYLMKLL